MPSGTPVADPVLRTWITLPLEVTERVKALAARRCVPVGAVLREFVMLGLERQVLVDRIADAVDPPRMAV